MASKYRANPKNIENFTQNSESTIPQNIQDYSEFLPNVNKTESMTRFFKSSVNQLLSSGSTESIDKYWGKRSGQNSNFANELYNVEDDDIRNQFQLEPGTILKSENQVEAAISYINWLKRLESIGVDISNHDKLFSEPGYVLDLPINYDMFVNYQNYYWIEDDSNLVIDLNIVAPNITDSQYSVTSNFRTLDFMTGMKINFTDGEYHIENVGGVGGIKLVADYSNQSLIYENMTGQNKSYIVMERWATDLNPWTRSNKWISEKTLRTIAEFKNLDINDYINSQNRAKRPIIEFKANMELYNFGKRHIKNVDYIIDNEEKLEIEGSSGYEIDAGTLEDGDIVLVVDDDFIDTADQKDYRISGTSEFSLDSIIENANMVTGTASGHNFMPMDRITVSEVNGSTKTNLNGTFVVDSVSGNTFTYSSPDGNPIGQLTNIRVSDNVVEITKNDHGLIQGDAVTIDMVGGSTKTNINGDTFIVAETPFDENTFAYLSPDGPKMPISDISVIDDTPLDTSMVAADMNDRTMITITTSSPHGFEIGRKIEVSNIGSSNPDVNGSYDITGVTTNTITYQAASVIPDPIDQTTGKVRIIDNVKITTSNIHDLIIGDAVSVSINTAFSSAFSNSFTGLRADGPKITNIAGDFIAVNADIANNTFTYSSPSATINISDVSSNGSIVTIVSPNHGFRSGDSVTINNVDGDTKTNINGNFSVTDVAADGNSFTYNSPNIPLSNLISNVEFNDDTNIVTITYNDHGLIVGDAIRISDVAINPKTETNINGDFIIDSIENNNTFTYSSPDGNPVSISDLSAVSGTITVTINDHNFETGETIVVENVSAVSKTNIEGTFIATRINDNTFTYSSPDGNPLTVENIETFADNIIVTTNSPHELSIGDNITVSSIASVISGVVDQANGNFEVISVESGSKFTYTTENLPENLTESKTISQIRGIDENTIEILSTEHGLAIGEKIRIEDFMGSITHNINGQTIIQDLEILNGNWIILSLSSGSGTTYSRENVFRISTSNNLPTDWQNVTGSPRFSKRIGIFSGLFYNGFSIGDRVWFIDDIENAAFLYDADMAGNLTKSMSATLDFNLGNGDWTGGVVANRGTSISHVWFIDNDSNFLRRYSYSITDPANPRIIRNFNDESADINLGRGLWRGGVAVAEDTNYTTSEARIWFIDDIDNYARCYAYDGNSLSRHSSADVSLGNGDWTGAFEIDNNVWFIDDASKYARGYVRQQNGTLLKTAANDLNINGINNITRRNESRDFDNLDMQNTHPLGIWANATPTTPADTMYVVDNADDGISSKIFAYDFATKARDNTEDFDTLVDAGNLDARRIWSNGTIMWATDHILNKLFAYNLTTKARVETEDFNTLTAAGNTGPIGLWSNATTMYIADNVHNKIFAYHLSTKKRDPDKDIDLHIENTDPRGIWSDGITMYVVDDVDNKIFAYTMSGTRETDKDINILNISQNTDPRGIWSDGTVMYVADDGDNKLFAYNLSVADGDIDFSNRNWYGGIASGNHVWLIEAGQPTYARKLTHTSATDIGRAESDRGKDKLLGGYDVDNPGNVIKKTTIMGYLSNSGTVKKKTALQNYALGTGSIAKRTAIINPNVSMAEAIRKTEVMNYDNTSTEYSGQFRKRTALIDWDGIGRFRKRTELRNYESGTGVVSKAFSLVDNSTVYNNGDYVTIGKGIDKGKIYYNTGDDSSRNFIESQNKDSRSDHPLFNLYAYDENHEPMAMDEEFINNDFEGDKIFGYKTDPTNQIDNELGLNVIPKSTQLGDYQFEWNLNNQKYNKNISDTTMASQIPGYYFWKDSSKDTHYNGWSLVRGNQRVPIIQSKIADGNNDVTFDLGTTTFNRSTSFTVENDSGDLKWYENNDVDKISLGEKNPTLIWEKGKSYTIDGETLTFTDPSDANTPIFLTPIPSSYTKNKIVYRLNGTIKGEIFLSDHNQDRIQVFKNGHPINFTLDTQTITINKSLLINGDLIEVSYISDENITDAKYDVAPIHYFNNQNKPIRDIRNDDLSRHLRQQMQAMPGFNGDASGDNNYFEMPRIHNYGGSIRQQIFKTPTIQYLLDQNDINPIKSLRTVARDYSEFKENFRNKVSQLYTSDTWTDINALVDRALNDINIGKSAEFKYAHSDMAFATNKEFSHIPFSAVKLGFFKPATVGLSGGVLTGHDGSTYTTKITGGQITNMNADDYDVVLHALCTLEDRIHDNLSDLHSVNNLYDMEDFYESNSSKTEMEINTDLEPYLDDWYNRWLLRNPGGDRTTWMNDSEYKFALADAYLHLKPIRTHDMFWKLNRWTINSNTAHDQWIDPETLTRTHNSQLHTEPTIADNGSQSIPTLLGFNSLVVEQSNLDSVTLSTRLKNLDINYMLHVGGYTDKRILSLELDGNANATSSIMPQNQYHIFLNQNAPTKTEFYSGVKIEKENSVYKVSGYNFDNGEFNFRQPSTSGSQRTITVNGRNIIKYANWPIQATITYGDSRNSIQDLYSFLIGLGEHYQAIGFDVLNNWESQAIRAVEWAMSNDTEPFYANGINDVLRFNHRVKGTTERVDTNYDGAANVIDQNSKAIHRNRMLVLRDEDSTNYSMKDGSSSIYGLGIQIIEFEHLISIDNDGAPNIPFYIPEIGLNQDRIKLNGERTRNWNGLIESSGYLIKNDGIMLNIASGVREIERDWINSDSKALDHLTRQTVYFNVGYSKPPYMIDTYIDDKAAYHYEQGLRKARGTRQIVDSFAKNRRIFGDNDEST